MEPNPNPSNNFMNLMKDWYEQSGKLLELMINSFAEQNELNQFYSNDGSGTANKLNENIWLSYMNNFEHMLNKLGSSFSYNKDLFEGVTNSWKEFQDSMGRYINMFDGSDRNNDLQSDVWKKWFDYSNIMNRQMLESYYTLYCRRGESSQDDPQSSQSGTPISTSALFGNMSSIDEASLNDMNEIIGRFYSDVTKELMAVNEGVLLRNESSVEKSQEFIEKWSGMYNKFLSELIRTPAYNIILNDNLKRSLDAKKKLDEAMEDNWKLLGLPTRTDMLELHKELHDMKLRINRLTKKMD